MRRYATLLAFLLAPLLQAATFRFDPAAPTNDTTTKVTFSGTLPVSCLPNGPARVIVDGNAKRITIRFEYAGPGDLCPAIIVPFTRSVNLGLLPAGVYDVVAQLGLGNSPSALGSTKLVVRDVTTYTVSPAFAPISGGTLVTVSSQEPFDVEPLHGSLGGQDVSITRINTNTIQFNAPPHAAGAVDLIVESVMGGRHVATAAFTYYDPQAATPDPFLFTYLLFPIDFAVPGAFGSLWTTDNWVETSAGKQKLPVTGSASGVVYPLPRSESVSANSRIRDTSRATLNAGSEIPVVREADFADHVRLLNIPTGKNFRALLRVWTSGEPATRFFYDIDQVPGLVPSVAKLSPAQGGLLYGTSDLTPFLDLTNDHLDLYVFTTLGTRIWAMVSITNNDTQDVTIISPQ